jgi:predicted ATP-grasp superfamily ATP-dependent carboligase
MIFAILVLQAISVMSGTVTDANGTEIKISAGTFIPSPDDKELAKKLIDSEFNLKQANVTIDSLKSQMAAIEESCRKKEEAYLDEVVSLKRQIESMSNWWNEWGKIVFPGIAAGVLGGYVGYEIGN